MACVRSLLECRFMRCFMNVRLLTASSSHWKEGTGDSNGGGAEFDGPIPRDKLKISFARSSGPGGQNVNKLNTKVEVRFNVNEADWLSDWIKTRLNKLFSTRLTKGGEFIVTSDKHRTQSQNITDALLKLEKYIKEASEVPKGPSNLTKERISLLKHKSKMRRLREKKYNSIKKNNRRDYDE